MHTPHPTLPTEGQASAFARALNSGFDWADAAHTAGIETDLITGTDGSDYIVAATYFIERLTGPHCDPSYTVVTADRETVERFADALQAELADEETADDCAHGDWQGALDNACAVSRLPIELVLDYAPGCPWAGFVVGGIAHVCTEEGEPLAWIDASRLERWLGERRDEDCEIECPSCGDAHPGICSDCERAYGQDEDDEHYCEDCGETVELADAEFRDDELLCMDCAIERDDLDDEQHRERQAERNHAPSWVRDTPDEPVECEGCDAVPAARDVAWRDGHALCSECAADSDAVGDTERRYWRERRSAAPRWAVEALAAASDATTREQTAQGGGRS